MPLSEPTILTPTGPRLLADIPLGSRVISGDGQTTTLVAKTVTHGPYARLTLKDERQFEAPLERHIRYFAYSAAKRPKFAPVSEVLVKYTHQTSQGYTKYNYRLIQNPPVEFPAQSHIIAPYALGVLIGDGCLTSKTSLLVSSNEADVMERFADSIGYPFEQVVRPKRKDDGTFQNYNWLFTYHDSAKIVRTELKALGLTGAKSRDKFIPESYLYDSIENRRALLAGLLETDGHASLSHKGALHHAYSTMNPHLAEQVRWLAQSLGHAANKNEYFTAEGELNDISVRIFPQEIPVSSDKQLATISKGHYVSFYPDMMPIVHVEEIGNAPIYALTFDNGATTYLDQHFIVTASGS